MIYPNEGLKPTKREPGEAILDDFMDWYGEQLGLTASIICRPDKIERNAKAPDGVYKIGSLRLVTEHSYFNETNNNKEEVALASFFQNALKAVPNPQSNYSYRIVFEPGYLMEYRSKSKQLLMMIFEWFQNEAASITATDCLENEDASALLDWIINDTVLPISSNTLDGYIKVEKDSLHFYVSVIEVPQGKGRISLGRLSDKLTSSILQNIITTRLDTKLPKLLNYYKEDTNFIRLLFLQNDEISHTSKIQFWPFIRDYLRLYPELICDEIWMYERKSEERLLQWSRALDTLESPNPYQSHDYSLGELYEMRLRKWRESRLHQF